mmetsp:Transcript_30069/g.58888  ORF Transcript_30069/g.58888 Transcript_30069/m.58888 type:complete len:306 (+) Transcript_30069:27-944(+)|eukprot:CAMPEP_0175143962 /NCGR_PEP_ID=MMETSP0087-20121206/13813_1 /TAXON_ID=136419 /ORGANISM="Unknown Unknown, Strain D1" /LENGTH=305 /DNA_ID=CAMNT_0016428269 /DNA_START=27 /DNA_END=947 /DNA_ORIENTATION=+
MAEPETSNAAPAVQPEEPAAAAAAAEAVTEAPGDKKPDDAAKGDKKAEGKEEKKEEEKLVLKHGYRDMESAFAELLTALKECEEKKVKELIWAVPIQDRCEFVNQITQEGKTAVMLCLDVEQVDMLQDLLDYGADPNALDFKRFTPLHFACLKMNKRAIKLLIQYGADISIENTEYNKCHQMVKDTLSMQNYLNACIDAAKELLKEKRVIPCTRQQKAFMRSIYDIIDTRQQGRTRIDEVAPLLDIAMNGVLESPDIRYVVDWFRGIDVDKRGILTFQDFCLALQMGQGGGGGGGKKGKKGSKKK